MLNLIVTLLVVASSIWVYWDATSNKIGKYSDAKGMFNMSAGAWAVVTLLLWIIVFPAYLIKRSSLIEKAKDSPIDVSWRGGKLAALSIVGGLWILGSAAGPQGSSAEVSLAELASGCSVTNVSGAKVAFSATSIPESVNVDENSACEQ